MINWSFVYLVSEWAILLVMLLYVPQRRSPAGARTWLLLIFLLPWPGLVLYALVGRIYLPRRRINLQAKASTAIRALRSRLPRGRGSTTIDVFQRLRPSSTPSRNRSP